MTLGDSSASERRTVESRFDLSATLLWAELAVPVCVGGASEHSLTLIFYFERNYLMRVPGLVSVCEVMESSFLFSLLSEKLKQRPLHAAIAHCSVPSFFHSNFM